MNFITLWLISITGTTLFLALADSLMPSGAVKKVGRLLCGLLLLLMIMKPFMQLSPDSLSNLSTKWQEEITSQTEEQKKYYNSQLKSLIETQLEAYIFDKAMELGIDCQPKVVCELNNEELYVPVYIDLGDISTENFLKLEEILIKDLEVAPTSAKGGNP